VLLGRTIAQTFEAGQAPVSAARTSALDGSGA
jgi:hypothetical protein